MSVLLRTFRHCSALNSSINWSQTRDYALSRFPKSRPIGSGRGRTQQPVRTAPVPREPEPTLDQSLLWKTSVQNIPSDSKERLKRLLLGNDELIIERQMEMLNIFIGYEQCNKYVITNAEGVTQAYITEEPGTFLASFGRQLFGTHRPFRALIMSEDGLPLLWLRRPFAFINSRMYVQRAEESTASDPSSETQMETFAEVRQIWAPLRRKYELFLRDTSNSDPILSTPSDPQPTPPPSLFSQFAYVDAPFLAWDFPLQGEHGQEIGLVTRSFRGFGREIFTDTGRYGVRFGPSIETRLPEEAAHELINMTLDERALTLALAVNIDFDYFSRHSHSGFGFGPFHIGGWD